MDESVNRCRRKEATCHLDPHMVFSIPDKGIKTVEKDQTPKDTLTYTSLILWKHIGIGREAREVGGQTGKVTW